MRYSFCLPVSIWVASLVSMIYLSCNNSGVIVDHIFYNGTVYTVDSAFTKATAFAIKDGLIVGVGTDDEIKKYRAGSMTDLKGKYVIPGFHDGHCHFYGYGSDLKKIWLIGTTSFRDALDTLVRHKDKNIGGWIFGRGWDQNDWEVKEYPDKTMLDSLFPDVPVFLLRIDGHAALANQVALDRAGVNNKTQIAGGLIEQKAGKLTGILIDAAVDLVYNVVPRYTRDEEREALLNAQDKCFEAGITSVTDAGFENNGLTWSIISLIDSLQKTGMLKMKVNAMASIKEADRYKKQGKLITPSLTVQSFKVYADGSLGSRGACLLEDYTDQAGHRGFLMYTPSQLDSLAALSAELDFQMNTHCIGDSAHRLMLQIYARYIAKNPDNRWRIEHAQVINQADFNYYNRYNILPSVQPIHATSDMYWAEKRIGPERITGAYAYKMLLQQNGILISGSDFPVEPVNPLYGIYAAVARKDQSGYPENGFEPSNRLTREEALRSFTIWPSYGAFTEKVKGSIEKNKAADFVILDDDIMNITESDIWKITVHATYIDGQPVYQRGK